mmetsp:Transcript_13036/g.34628  ORF Transcript_13036/g.34628 Transcript_13036/m.34628 type:complete len:238 (-) Transcript_13036:42-755(-)
MQDWPRNFRKSEFKLRPAEQSLSKPFTEKRHLSALSWTISISNTRGEPFHFRRALISANIRAVPLLPCHGGAFAFFAVGSSSESAVRSWASRERFWPLSPLSSAWSCLAKAASDAIVSPITTSSSESDTSSPRFFLTSFLALLTSPPASRKAWLASSFERPGNSATKTLRGLGGFTSAMDSRWPPFASTAWGAGFVRVARALGSLCGLRAVTEHRYVHRSLRCAAGALPAVRWQTLF